MMLHQLPSVGRNWRDYVCAEASSANANRLQLQCPLGFREQNVMSSRPRAPCPGGDHGLPASLLHRAKCWTTSVAREASISLMHELWLVRSVLALLEDL